MAKARTSQILESGWSFRQTDGPDDWRSVPRVPTNVHLDLLAHKQIPDPFIGLNEIDVGWVGEKSWSYRVDLPPIPQSVKDTGARVALVFEGLDTFANVLLNGQSILCSDNMFMSHRLDISDSLQERNKLEIIFEPALLKAREIKSQHPEHKWVGFNAEMARLAVRKAQYHWGWDWGPVLMTCGPWRPVRLEVYQARIDDIYVDYTVSDHHKSVQGAVKCQVDGPSGSTVDIKVAIPDKESVFKGTAAVKDGTVTIPFSISNVSLWHPRGYGPQTLYTVNATLRTDGGELLDSQTQKLGFRSVKLIQTQDDIGRSFHFNINGVDIFCGGSDWIPGDSFLPRISAQDYHKWLEIIANGNQVMVRVWGGGIYEDNAFYNSCDELGILVWQDFMFGCGNYPTFPAILESVQKEAVQNVRRLRHHPCMAIWAGNNEDYQVQEQEGLEYNFEDKDPQSWLKSNFPARYIYEKILPDVMQKECPSVPYHPGSPWGDGKVTFDPTVGDMHQWNVWHGTQEKYQIFEHLGGRFNSEFGMEAFPHTQTIHSFVTESSELHPQSATLDFHNKADGHERRIATYLVENFRMTTDLEKYIHLTQLVQAEALMFAYRGWRRQWGQKRRCGGALVWQINDCWPGTSWAIVDYFRRKKAAYYSLARVLAPIAVGVQREHHDWSVAHARPAKSSRFSVWAVNSKPYPVEAQVELRFVAISTGDDIKPSVSKTMQLVANGTTEVINGVIDNVKEMPHVLAARIHVDGQVIARDVDWPQPYKYLSFSDRGVTVCQDLDGEKGTIHLSCKRPTKGLVFEERDGVVLSDSAIDLVPGDGQVVRVSGVKSTIPLRYMYLGM
ncbi:hypothetical protein PHISCL_01510 [Aspergillus sclerotialis]|uniref:Beta-mannosidase B n=1 Tax=Aspergillus sclerotialis TaxID=2070753 RepID=A0A3A2ZTX5_9EURO|nr:hypothetical protein PHISCL_01510 [Aspergillus sclerotialis]